MIRGIAMIVRIIVVVRRLLITRMGSIRPGISWRLTLFGDMRVFYRGFPVLIFRDGHNLPNQPAAGFTVSTGVPPCATVPSGAFAATAALESAGAPAGSVVLAVAFVCSAPNVAGSPTVVDGVAVNSELPES